MLRIALRNFESRERLRRFLVTKIYEPITCWTQIIVSASLLKPPIVTRTILRPEIIGIIHRSPVIDVEGVGEHFDEGEGGGVGRNDDDVGHDTSIDGGDNDQQPLQRRSLKLKLTTRQTPTPPLSATTAFETPVQPLEDHYVNFGPITDVIDSFGIGNMSIRDIRSLICFQEDVTSTQIGKITPVSKV